MKSELKTSSSMQGIGLCACGVLICSISILIGAAAVVLGRCWAGKLLIPDFPNFLDGIATGLAIISAVQSVGAIVFFTIGCCVECANIVQKQKIADVIPS